MRRIELLKQKHDLKIALRRARSAASKVDPIDPNYPFSKKKDKVRTRLKRSLIQADLKKSLRRTASQDSCLHSGNQWYTFSNPNCYNQLDEVIVEGVDKSKRRHKLNTSLVKKDRWWNKPIDVSFKNPWPEARWDWFENNVSGNPVWGTGGGTMELGNRRGNNSVVGSPYYMDEFVIPAGVGAGMKFWANLDNWAKYGIKAVQIVSGGIEQGKTLREEYDRHFEKEKRDTTVTARAFNVDKIHLETKSFSTSIKKVKFSGDKEKVLRSLDSLQRKNENEQWYIDNWFDN